MKPVSRRAFRHALGVLMLAALGGLAPDAFAADAAESLLPGIAARFANVSGTNTDSAVLPSLLLYTAAGQAPTPFLPAGQFTAEWSGVLRLDLRGDYAFQANLSGDLKLELNGKTVLDVRGASGDVQPGGFVRLNKGENTLAATYRSPASGPAQLQLQWIPKGGTPAPLPLNALFHRSSPDEIAGERRRLGRELFIEHRCAKCHPPGAATGIPELSMDAPAFDGIGSRLNRGWMAKWILDPKAERPTARMSRMLSGPEARQESEAMAAFLATLRETVPAAGNSAGDPNAGRRLFEALHCAACHHPPRAAESDPQKISLARLDSKFRAGALRQFLLKPEARHAWTRMPNFHLSAEEAAALAEFLVTAPPPVPPEKPEAAADAALIERGRELVQTRGCLNCHAAAALENRFKAPALAALKPEAWNHGCVAPEGDRKPGLPAFAFTPAESGALAEFGATGRESLLRDAPAEFALRQMKALRCAECHGQTEGIPAVEMLGGKLKPEWTARFLAGEIRSKPRPWMEARMPGFGIRSSRLAAGMAALHGFPPESAAEPAPDAEAAKVGKKLLGMEGGFACTACHPLGEVPAVQPGESPGINLALSSGRLLKGYFVRWVRNPQSIDPATKMPLYFDEEGRSPLTDCLGGDGAKQIDAIWDFLRAGGAASTRASER